RRAHSTPPRDIRRKAVKIAACRRGGRMSLGQKLAVVFVAFLAILVGVIYMAFRERRLGKAIDASDLAAQQASDSRMLLVVFSAIFGGMFLTLLVAWLVFF